MNSAALGKLAWPWYVPLGTAVTVCVGMAASLLRGAGVTDRRGARLASVAPVLWDRTAELRLFSFSRPVDGDAPVGLRVEVVRELISEARDGALDALVHESGAIDVAVVDLAVVAHRLAHHGDGAHDVHVGPIRPDRELLDPRGPVP